MQASMPKKEKKERRWNDLQEACCKYIKVLFVVADIVVDFDVDAGVVEVVDIVDANKVIRTQHKASQPNALIVSAVL